MALLAILTIAVSLFIGGTFLLVSRNLSRSILEWRAEARVVVYLEPDVPLEALVELRREIHRQPWVMGIEEVSAEQAQERFVAAFPGLEGLVSTWEETLPPSLEVGFDPEQLNDEAFTEWLGTLRAAAGVGTVDDDREWLRQLEVFLAILRGAGLFLGGVLLVAAVFTIASVVRLTAYLYRDEIAVMRVVGATEFFIRGPFWVEGLLQGLTGGGLALTALLLAYQLLVVRGLPAVLGSVLFGGFLSAGELLLLLALGAGAGLLGAALSVRQETHRRSGEFGAARPRVARSRRSGTGRSRS